MKKSALINLTVVAASIGAMQAAQAQSYPNHPIRIVTGGVGGGADFAARLIAQGLTASLGQQVVVDNRPNGVIPGEIVSKAAPDGYTLLVAGSSLWLGPLLRQAPYDTVRDFLPITLATASPTILVVHPALPAHSLKELIALAKARPGQLNYASAATGSSTHLAMELFKSMAGVNIVRVPYKGGAQAISDLIGGQVQLTFATGGEASPHIKSGKLRALAITTTQPSALVPGVPPMTAAGVPGYECITMLGAFAPAATPSAIIVRLNQEIVRFLGSPDYKERLFRTGVEAVGSTPEEFGIKIKSEIARMGKVIKDAGIREE